MATFWSMYRPSTIKVAGKKIQAGEALGPHQHCHGRRPRLECSNDCRVASIPRQRYASDDEEEATQACPLEAMESRRRARAHIWSWGWLWSKDIRPKLKCHGAPDGPPYVWSHTSRRRTVGGVEQAISATRSLVGLEERTHLTLPVHYQPLCQAVGELPDRHDCTFLRRLMAWRSRTHNVYAQGVAAEVDPSRMHWKRRRTGRPPQGWEAPLAEACGQDWFRRNHLDAVYLGQVLGVELPEQPCP